MLYDIAIGQITKFKERKKKIIKKKSNHKKFE